MGTRKKKKSSPLSPHVDADIAIADVPVKITFYHGDELLDEYDDIIDLEFNRNSEKGGILGLWLGELYRKGLSTEDALFTIASEMIKAEAVEKLQSLRGTELHKKAIGHEIQIRVKRNGEITYKMPFKE
jgi:hypothetical protein